MANWLAIGPADNWKIGVRKKVWAVNGRNKKSWDRLQPPDTVFCYAIAPVKGIVGYGTVGKTSVSKTLFWPQEKDEGVQWWPYHIEFSEVTVISTHDWETKRVVPDHKGIVFQRAFQPVDEKRAKEWLKALAKVAV